MTNVINMPGVVMAKKPEDEVTAEQAVVWFLRELDQVSKFNTQELQPLGKDLRCAAVLLNRIVFELGN